MSLSTRRHLHLNSQLSYGFSHTEFHFASEPINETWNVYNQASNGHFAMNLTFPDKGNETVSVKDIPYNASPLKLVSLIETAIRTRIKDVAAFDFDLKPVVLANGMGTEAFPWRLTFANVGRVNVALDKSNTGSIKTGLSGAGSIVPYSATAVSGGSNEWNRGRYSRDRR